ncbi:MAG: 50S ribosomal protein L18 [Deltaproteobacteria bacterium]|nr:50S ribosomal protein L18 [Deltaproteobacteria bacterium]
MASISRAKSREKRKKRVRRKVLGTSERPRLSVFRSAKNIYAQIIDDTSFNTLVQVSTISKDIRDELKGKSGNREGASMIGKLIAQRAQEKGIKKVVFDRNGFLYHGRIKSLAEAAREGGLEF